MLVERDAFISQLFAKTHPGADARRRWPGPRRPPPTIGVEAPPLAKAEEADGDAADVASVPASDERARRPSRSRAALCVEPPPASVAV